MEKQLDKDDPEYNEKLEKGYMDVFYEHLR